MKRTRVLILFGGCSPEYEVSLQSACAVIEGLDSRKYETILMGITREGKWYRYYGSAQRISQGSWQEDVERLRPAMISPNRDSHKIIEFYMGMVEETEFDIAFPVLHGKNGEDGTVQGILELAGIPMVGCGVLSSALCMDKDRAHRLAAAAGVQVPKGLVITAGRRRKEWKAMVSDSQLHYPLFIKPVKAGSSFGIAKILEEGQLEDAIEQAFQFDNEVIVEEQIEGFEVGCAVMGNDKLMIGAVDEIELADGFFDYTEKYTLKTSRIHMPARIDAQLSETIRRTAAVIYQALGCKGFARVDMFLTPEHQVVFNEVNTIPGFTSHSRYPNMMKGIGMGFEELLDRLISLGLE